PSFAVLVASLNLAALARGEETSPIRVGIIGLDNYQAVAFTTLFHSPKAEGDLAGLRVVAVYPVASPDIEESVENLPRWVERFEKIEGVEFCDSIDALLAKVDAVLVMSL